MGEIIYRYIYIYVCVCVDIHTHLWDEWLLSHASTKRNDLWMMHLALTKQLAFGNYHVFLAPKRYIKYQEVVVLSFTATNALGIQVGCRFYFKKSCFSRIVKPPRWFYCLLSTPQGNSADSNLGSEHVAHMLPTWSGNKVRPIRRDAVLLTTNHS